MEMSLIHEGYYKYKLKNYEPKHYRVRPTDTILYVLSFEEEIDANAIKVYSEREYKGIIEKQGVSTKIKQEGNCFWIELGEIERKHKYLNFIVDGVPLLTCRLR